MTRFVYFRKNEDDAYLNAVENFRGATQGAASGKVDVHFAAASATVTGNTFDKITLSVEDGKEKEVMQSIANTMGGCRQGTTIVIADKFGNKYYDHVTDVDSISLTTASLSATNATLTTPSITESVLVKTDDYTITAADSGSTIVMNDTDAVFTLPTCAAGLNYKIVLAQDTVAGAKIAAGASDHFFGSVTVTTTTAFDASNANVAAQSVDLATTTKDEVVFTHDSATLGGKAGDVVYITGITDAAWCVDANLLTDGADPASIAVIV